MTKETDKQSYKLICYMTVSARNLVDETKMYGPFRLLDATSRLIKILEEAGQSNPKLSQIREKIEDNKHKVMTDRDQFISSIDDIVLDLIEDMDSEI